MRRNNFEVLDLMVLVAVRKLSLPSVESLRKLIIAYGHDVNIAQVCNALVKLEASKLIESVRSIANEKGKKKVYLYSITDSGLEIMDKTLETLENLNCYVEGDEI